MNKTIFLDIDGCIFKHHGNYSKQTTKEPIVLPGTVEKLIEWESEGHMIILTTGRKEPMRKKTEEQLTSFGIIYDQLVMGCLRGERVIINDRKVDSDMSVAKSIEVDRNKGITDIIL